MARKRTRVSIKKDGKIERTGNFIETSSGVQWNIPHAEKHLTMCEKNSELNIHTTDQTTGKHDKGIVGSELEVIRGPAIDISAFKVAHADDKIVAEIRIATFAEQMMEALGPTISSTFKEDGAQIDVDETRERAKQVDIANATSTVTVLVRDYEFPKVSADTLLLIASADGQTMWLLTYTDEKWYAADFSEKTFEAFRALWRPRVEHIGKFFEDAVRPSNTKSDKL